ncbi:MAG: sodium:solute symporter [Acidobacteria bacterium RBG_13_68_16]|nr:MAG: sodium:solute symporter [Acidobacteria bacterium RBG_13_68_16]
MNQQIASIWHPIDIAVLVLYFAAMVGIGVAVMRKASRGLDSYFLAGKELPWYILGISNASAMWDITGTMWLVYNIFVYGMKGIWLPWLWPTFNQVFLAVYLASWIRRSNVLTGAEWMTSRFGEGRGAELSRVIVVIFALVSVVGFIAYDFQGMGKFTASFLPWNLSPNTYGILIMTVTAIYVLLGGMISVVITDVAQFVIMAICSLVIAGIAMAQVSPEQIAAVVPAGWSDVFFGWRLDLDWSATIPAITHNIANDGYSIFGLFFMAMLFKGILVSIAGPAPNYDMQRVLAAKSPKQASLMSAVVSAALLPRWWMIGGITVLAIHYLGPTFKTMTSADFEMVLPWVIREKIPAGLLGVLLAGLLASFMSTFSATLNAGGAYLVNDLYKRYIKRDAAPKHYIHVSYVAQIAILALGIFFGFQAASINQVTQWIVNGLWGGYTAPNLLKWHWWRFNGFGYFWGMVAGIAAALAVPKLFPNLSPLAGFAPIFIVSIIASILGSLLSDPEPDSVLIRFYRQVRPWGFWGPVLRKVRAEEPSFQANRNAARDAFNVGIGIAAQMTLVTIPLYMILRDWKGFWISILILAVTTVILKKTWLDKLEAA